MIGLVKNRLCCQFHSEKWLICKRLSSTGINIEKLEKESLGEEVTEISNEELKLQEEIQRSRNKSGLSSQDRNVLHEVNPYPEPKLWHHGTIKYLRKTYGRYGAASGVNPSICWPLKEEFEDKKEYERVAFPQSIREMIEQAKREEKEKEERIWNKQNEIAAKLKKLDQWKKDLNERIQKKENEIKAAKERRERLVEEVRRHFGYSVDPRDEKFKEMLEKKEKEQRKAMKEARKKLREDKELEESKKKKDNAKKKSEIEDESEDDPLNK